MHEIASTRT